MKRPCRKRRACTLWLALLLPVAAWGASAPNEGAYISPRLLGTPAPGTGKAMGFSSHQRTGWVRCQLELSKEIADPTDLEEWLEREVPGAEWEGHWKRWVQIDCRVADVPRLALLPGAVVAARPPFPVPLSTTETEGTELLGAPFYWNLGHTGEDVRIAIIDVGFDGYEALLGSELPARVKTRSFFGSTGGRGDLTGGGQPHGTGVAEIVHDVAPRADLLLTNASTAVELAKCVEWALEEGADVINHSVGWFFGPGDGTGEIASVVEKALEEDVLWINAAGNFANSHWEGPYRDRDEDGALEFDEFGDEELNLGLARENPEVTLVLGWNRWPFSTDLFLDIEIWNRDHLAATSETLFGGEPYAFRAVSWEPQSGSVSIRIRLTDGDPSIQPDLRLEVFRLDGGSLPEHGVAEGSLVIPADVPEVIAVGAVHWSTIELEPFSSWGPTSSGIEKPELLAPDAVSNVTLGTFRGTSAAAAHVTGAVALLQSAAPRGGMAQSRWSISETRTFLRRSAEEAGSTPQDAVAWGVVKLPQYPQDVAPGEKAFLVSPNPARGGRAEIRLLAPYGRSSDELWSLRIYDVRGRRIWSKRLPRSELARGFSLTGQEGWAAGTYWIHLLGPGVRRAERWVRLEE